MATGGGKPRGAAPGAHAALGVDPDRQVLALHEVDTLAVCAVRYALGRQSYVVADVARLVIGLTLSENIGVVIARDVDRAIREGRAGALIDVAEWSTLRDHLLATFPRAAEEIRRDARTFPGPEDRG